MAANHHLANLKIEYLWSEASYRSINPLTTDVNKESKLLTFGWESICDIIKVNLTTKSNMAASHDAA